MDRTPVLPRRRARGGFTLVELLLVVVILGIVAVVAAPRVGPLLSGGRLRMGAREIAAAGRYARMMALMNQTPVDVIFRQSGSQIEIRAREASSASVLGLSDLAALTNVYGYTESLLETSARRRASLTGGFGIALSRDERDAVEWRGAAAETGVDRFLDGEPVADAPDTVSFEDSVNLTRQIPGVKVEFDGYRDTVESRSAYARLVHGEGLALAGDQVVVRYRANGTVRPHVILVRSESNPSDFMRVTVNAVGTATLTDGAED